MHSFGHYLGTFYKNWAIFSGHLLRLAKLGRKVQQKIIVSPFQVGRTANKRHSEHSTFDNKF